MPHDLIARLVLRQSHKRGCMRLERRRASACCDVWPSTGPRVRYYRPRRCAPRRGRESSRAPAELPSDAFAEGELCSTCGAAALPSPISSGHRLSFSQGPPLWFRSHTIAGRNAVRAGTHGMSCQGPPAVSNCKIPPDIGIRNIHGMGCQHRVCCKLPWGDGRSSVAVRLLLQPPQWH